jgi:hypothetical protein
LKGTGNHFHSLASADCTVQVFALNRRKRHMIHDLDKKQIDRYKVLVRISACLFNMEAFGLFILRATKYKGKEE